VWKAGKGLVYVACGVSSAKTADSMEMAFATWTWLAPRNHALGGGKLPQVWHCSSDVAFCQITLTSCLTYSSLRNAKDKMMCCICRPFTSRIYAEAAAKK